MNVNRVLKSGKVFGRKCTQQSESRRVYVLIRPKFKNFDNMSNFYLDKVKHCAAETAETLFAKLFFCNSPWKDLSFMSKYRLQSASEM